MDSDQANVTCFNSTVCSNSETVTGESSMQTDNSVSWQDEIFPRAVFQGVILTLETIVGLMGNGILVYLILTRRNLKNICNFYILNRAIADILFQLPNPMIAIAMFKLKFTFGYAGCLFFSLAGQIPFLISVITFIFMCVDCYKSTPHGYHSQTYRANLLKRGMCILWITGLVLTVPFGYLTIYKEGFAKDGKTLEWAICTPKPVLHAYNGLSFFANLILYLAIPLLVIWFYIWKAFRHNLGDVPYVNSRNEGGLSEGRTTSDVAITKLNDDVVFSKQFIIALATLFSILDLVFWLASMSHVPEFGIYVPFLYEASSTLLDVHVVIKPIICILFANDLKQEFIKLLPIRKSSGNQLQGTEVRNPQSTT